MRNLSPEFIAVVGSLLAGFGVYMLGPGKIGAICGFGVFVWCIWFSAHMLYREGRRW